MKNEDKLEYDYLFLNIYAELIAANDVSDEEAEMITHFTVKNMMADRDADQETLERRVLNDILDKKGLNN